MNWLDKRVLWDLIKYKIRQRTITFSKGQARKRGAKLQKVEDKLKECTEKCDNDPNSGNLEELGQSFALRQPGMKWVTKTITIF